jgi:hypothetical protein
MPNVNSYKRGFDVYIGLELANYKVYNLSVKHVPEVIYRLYSYPTKMTFIPLSDKANLSDLKKQLRKHVSGSRIIKTGYGNPYECKFGSLSFKESRSGQVEVSCEGKCKRIFVKK